MPVPLFHVDAFTDRPFGGNPAAVCPLKAWLDDELLLAVAAENNLSETAYFVREGDSYRLRWFSPRCEVSLCGHATLASAFVLLTILEPQQESVRFQTRSGLLTVTRQDDLLAMDFPALVPWACAQPPADLVEGLGAEADRIKVLQIEDNYFVAYDSEDEIRSVRPDLLRLERLHPAGVAVTAAGKDAGFVSRYFAPSYGIPEDPVTGLSPPPYENTRSVKLRSPVRAAVRKRVAPERSGGKRESHFENNGPLFAISWYHRGFFCPGR